MRIGAVLEGAVPLEIVTPQPRHGCDRWPQRLEGRRVNAVSARGKHLFIAFDGGLTLHSHLRMTGAWGVYEHGRRWARAPHRAWLIMRAPASDVVQFDGPVLELMTQSRTRFDQRLAALGQDVLGERFDEEQLLVRLRAEDPHRAIGDALLDQRLLAGIGNVWKAEACFATGVSPWRPLGDVTRDELLAIVGFARENMRQSARDGFHARPREVYRRAGMPCRRCQTPIASRGQGDDNRITYWCPVCQR